MRSSAQPFCFLTQKLGFQPPVETVSITALSFPSLYIPVFATTMKADFGLHSFSDDSHSPTTYVLKGEACSGGRGGKLMGFDVAMFPVISEYPDKYIFMSVSVSIIADAILGFSTSKVD